MGNLLRYNAARQQRAHFGRKREALRRLSVIERLDAQGVAGEEKQWRGRKSSAQIQQRECKHAPKLGQALLAPLFPRMHQDFGI